MEKKACLITIHVGSNFGSVLQTYATCKVLERFGISITLLNYIPRRVTISGFLANRRTLKSKIKAIIGLPILCCNKLIYGGFVKQHCKLTKKIYNPEDYNKLPLQFNRYIVGSDQVWNSKHNEGVDVMYYFSYVPHGAIKVAFASSFGREILNKEEIDRIRPWLMEFSAISVRETSAISVLKTMGINTAIQIVDPTFLLSKEEWKAQLIKRQIINEPYLLMYLPYNIVDKNSIYHYARKIATLNNWKIVTFSWDVRKDKLADKTMIFASPKDFLSLMFYAEFVITNSFHGTAFSINLNKQFLTFSPSEFSTRICSILDLVNLRSRFITSMLDLSEQNKHNEKINYAPINDILDKEREKAFQFIRQNI